MVALVASIACFATSAFNVAVFVCDTTTYLNIAAAVFLFGMGIINTKLISK